MESEQELLTAAHQKIRELEDIFVLLQEQVPSYKKSSVKHVLTTINSLIARVAFIKRLTAAHLD